RGAARAVLAGVGEMEIGDVKLRSGHGSETTPGARACAPNGDFSANAPQHCSPAQPSKFLRSSLSLAYRDWSNDAGGNNEVGQSAKGNASQQTIVAAAEPRAPRRRTAARAEVGRCDAEAAPAAGARR